MATIPIKAVKTTNDTQEAVRRIAEIATMSSPAGSPMRFNGGFADVWDVDDTHLLIGFSQEDGSSLGTSGVPTTLSQGTAPFQPSGSVIPSGAKGNDGRIGIALAVSSTVFRGQVGPSQLAANLTIGGTNDLAKDTDDNWYVDQADAAAIVKIVGIVGANDPRGCYFVVVPAMQALPA